MIAHLAPLEITEADRTAALSLNFNLVLLCATRTQRIMLGAMIKAKGMPAEPVSAYPRGDILFAAVEFHGLDPLPVPLCLQPRWER